MGVENLGSLTWCGYPCHSTKLVSPLRFLGHKEDLAAAGCVRLNGVRYHHLNDDGHGGLLYGSSKVGPGKRRQIPRELLHEHSGFRSLAPRHARSFPEGAAALNALYDDFLEQPGPRAARAAHVWGHDSVGRGRRGSSSGRKQMVRSGTIKSGFTLTHT